MPRVRVTNANDVLEPVTTPRWKRILDLVVIVSSLPVVAPLIGIIVLFIRLVSSGPVFFKQTRIGKGGSPFTCYKFRTMKPGAGSEGHERHLVALIGSKSPMTKLDKSGDSRIIPGGRLLRSSGLDELPQLWNVLKGEMSIVGPRPCLPYEYALYTDHHKQRLEVAPGLTGLWQVSGKNRTTFDEMIDLDISYARRMSLAQDLMIMLKTGGVLLRQMYESFDRSPRSPMADRPASACERV